MVSNSGLPLLATDGHQVADVNDILRVKPPPQDAVVGRQRRHLRQAVKQAHMRRFGRWFGSKQGSIPLHESGIVFLGDGRQKPRRPVVEGFGRGIRRVSRFRRGQGERPPEQPTGARQVGNPPVKHMPGRRASARFGRLW